MTIVWHKQLAALKSGFMFKTRFLRLSRCSIKRERDLKTRHVHETFEMLLTSDGQAAAFRGRLVSVSSALYKEAVTRERSSATYLPLVHATNIVKKV